MSDTLVLMEGIDKAFPGVQALNQCKFELKAGEVHALVGENGAGKSTLVKVLTGVVRPDAGRIFCKGREVHIPNPRAAQELGISIIFQEFNLMPHLTIAENVFIGREPRARIPGFLDDAEINRKTRELLEMINLDLDPRTRVSELTVAMQQMVEIIKALSFNSEVLIMDEPTAALTDNEIDDLFRIIRKLRDQGVGIIYISHRLEELKQISDRVTVMRDGCYIDTVSTADTEISQIIKMMVGREVYHTAAEISDDDSNEILLEVRNLKSRRVHDVSFSVKKGEILGFAGLVGAGRTEVARLIFGADSLESGEMLVHGKAVRIRSPQDAVANGIGYLSEDRKQYGLVLGLDVANNVVMADFPKYLSFPGWVKTDKIAETAESIVDQLQIKTPSIKQKVKNLSGGNQQKVVIGKWLVKNCDILIFDEPTRGIDVGAKSEIYKLLNDLAAEGKAIIMISSELPEILRMSHRIVVMCEGRITGELLQSEATQERIMEFATSRMKLSG